jgi:FkbM family methyltransferase
MPLRQRLGQLFRRQLHGNIPAAASGTTGATREDISYCYRLLLNRPPDPEGWKFYTDLVDKTNLPVERLVAAFLESAEYREIQRRRGLVAPVVCDGFTVFARPGDLEVGAELGRSREYEPHVTTELLGLLRPSQVVVDVGANIGYFTMLAASRIGPSGRVIAFEPNPDNCALIRNGIEANGFVNVDLHAYGVADIDSDFAIDITGSNGALRQERRAGDVIVRTVILDSYLAHENRMDIVKMDIEGFEGRALRGMRQLLERHRPVIFTEFSPAELQRRSHIEPRAFIGELQAAGYHLFVLGHDTGRSQQPQTADDILAAHSVARTSHLDLVAYPR